MTRDTAAALLQKLEKIENSDGKKGFNDTEVEAAVAYLERSGISDGNISITARTLEDLKKKLADGIKAVPEDGIDCSQPTGDKAEGLLTFPSTETFCESVKHFIKIELEGDGRSSKVSVNVDAERPRPLAQATENAPHCEWFPVVDYLKERDAKADKKEELQRQMMAEQAQKQIEIMEGSGLNGLVALLLGRN
jgi:hypothetical protein